MKSYYYTLTTLPMFLLSIFILHCVFRVVNNDVAFIEALTQALEALENLARVFASIIS